jgi:hypothetical protein
MSNVKFINTLYFPDDVEKNRLLKLQDDIYRWSLELERDMKGLSPGERYLVKQRYHNGWRDRWLIYTGFKKDIKSS